MNQTTSNEQVLYLALGALVGGLAGYLTAEVIAYKMEERYQGMQEELTDYLEDNPETVKMTGILVENEYKLIEAVKSGPIDYAGVFEQKGDLAELAKPYATEPDIYVMSRNMWEEPGEPPRVKMPCQFFEEESIYTDVADEPIEDPVAVFGPNAHLHFGESSDDPDVVYIRNERNATDYEITRIHGSYKELVLGEVEEKEPPLPKRKRRAAQQPQQHVAPENEPYEEE